MNFILYKKWVTQILNIYSTISKFLPLRKNCSVVVNRLEYRNILLSREGGFRCLALHLRCGHGLEMSLLSQHPVRSGLNYSPGPFSNAVSNYCGTSGGSSDLISSFLHSRGSTNQIQGPAGLVCGWCVHACQSVRVFFHSAVLLIYHLPGREKKSGHVRLGLWVPYVIYIIYDFKE